MEKNEYNDDILIKQNDPDKTEYILSPSQHLYLKRYYGETIEIKEGEVFGFLGPNGARKDYNYKNDFRAFKY